MRASTTAGVLGAMVERVEVDCDHNGPVFAADPAGAQKALRERASLVRSTAYDGFFPLAERLVTSAVLAGAGFDAELLAAQLACLRGDNDEAERRFVDLQRRADIDSGGRTSRSTRWTTSRCTAATWRSGSASPRRRSRPSWTVTA